MAFNQVVPGARLSVISPASPDRAKWAWWCPVILDDESAHRPIRRSACPKSRCPQFGGAGLLGPGWRARGRFGDGRGGAAHKAHAVAGQQVLPNSERHPTRCGGLYGDWESGGVVHELELSRHDSQLGTSSHEPGVHRVTSQATLARSGLCEDGGSIPGSGDGLETVRGTPVGGRATLRALTIRCSGRRGKAA